MDSGRLSSTSGCPTPAKVTDTASKTRQAPVRLAELLPKTGEPELGPTEILDRFVTFVSGTGFSLYPAQEEAILELLSGKPLILNTPTGPRKPLGPVALHSKAMCEGKMSF